MACTPFPIPDQDLFLNDSEFAWASTNQTVGSAPNQRSATYSGGTLTVTGPNGSAPPFTPGLNQTVKHKFFGAGNFCAVLTLTSGGGNLSMSIVDFTANPTTSVNVMFLSSNDTPFLQHAKGSGSLCFIGATMASGTGGLGIFRSDTGESVCPGPPPFNPTMQLSAEVIGTTVQMKHGGTVIAGPCDFPAGELTITPSNPTFSTVKVGGCPQPASTKTFTLKNTGDDCLSVDPIPNVAPYSVTSTSVPLPTTLAHNQFFTATVTFAPSMPGDFDVDIPVTRSPANGDDSLNCSGHADLATPAMSVSPPNVNFDTVLIGTTSPQHSVTITNSGSVPITVSVAGSAGPLFKWTGKPSTALDCGATLTITDITFTPVDDEVLEEADLIVVSPQAPDKTVHLSGTGCLPNAEIVPDAGSFPDFGEVRQGYRMPRFITVQNTGDETLVFDAHISGPDAALFGLMKGQQSLTDIVVSPTPKTYPVPPITSCVGGGGHRRRRRGSGRRVLCQWHAASDGDRDADHRQPQ